VHTDRISLQIHYLDHGPKDEPITEHLVAYLALWLPSKPCDWAENWVREL
jgi:hypothetical protein